MNDQASSGADQWAIPTTTTVQPLKTLTSAASVRPAVTQSIAPFGVSSRENFTAKTKDLHKGDLANLLISRFETYLGMLRIKKLK